MRWLLNAFGLVWLGIALWAVAWPEALWAEDTEDFEKSSLAWRTALHFDPMAEVPLESLVGLYGKAGRLPELAGLYASHLGSYPDDVAATLVLGRIYCRTEDVRAEAFLKRALERFPEEAELVALEAEWLEAKHRPGVVEAKGRAILLARDSVRRDEWVSALIGSGWRGGEEERVVEILTEVVKRGDVTGEERLRWAGLALESGWAQAGAVLLEGVGEEGFTGERWVELVMMQSRLALSEGRHDAASARVDRLLERLAVDHWRRPEALRMRWLCAVTDEEREMLLEESREQWERGGAGEAEALHHGEMLVIAGRRAEAVKHLREALERLPESRVLESRVLELMESGRMDEEALDFLEVRMAAAPGRKDLAEMRARRLLGLGRTDEGLGVLEELTEGLSAGEALERLLGTARWLRGRNLFAEAAAVLEAGLKVNPGLWSLRRELGEMLATLRRSDQLAALFSGPVPDSVSLEVRMETAMFLVGQGLWTEAAGCLEGWVETHPAEFEARLLLARIRVLLGSEAEGLRLLLEARERADTAARYAAWLAAARGFAEEAGKEAAFLAEERERLEPSDGMWDAESLARLVQLGAFAAEASDLDEAESLVDDALAVPSLDAGVRRDLLVERVRLLELQPDRVKELEDLLRELLAGLDGGEDGAGRDDLRVRLALLYSRAGRVDLMRAEMARIDLERCEDAGLLAQLAPALQSRGWRRMHADCLERLVVLRPDHPENWTGLVSSLAELGDESALRARLMDLRMMLMEKGMPEGIANQIRDHWVSSCWRGIARVLGRGERRPSMAVVTPMLADLEAVELTLEQRLWKDWLVAWLTGASVDDWAVSDSDEVRFPDGLVFSKAAAENLLSGGEVEAKRPEEAWISGERPVGPLRMAWGLKAPTGRSFLRWDVLADRHTVVAMDSALRIEAVELKTGKLRWEREMGPWTAVPSAARVDAREIGVEPMEWAVADGALVVLAPMGLVCLDAETGEPRWEVPLLKAEGGMMPGVVAAEEGRVFWWRVFEGVLDAYEVSSGRLVWSLTYPELSRLPVTPSGQSVAVATGIDAADGKVLVWGNGNAVCTTEGQLVWKAAARDADAVFPLHLGSASTPDEGDEKVKRVRAAMSWSQFPASALGGAGEVWPVGTTLANPLGMAAPAFSGVYGQMSGSPWLTWGSEGVRKLDGERFWMVDRSGVSVCRALGIPLGTAAARTSSGRGFAAGVVNGTLITVSEHSVQRLMTDGTAAVLWSERQTGPQPAQQPMPAVGVDGRTLGVATRDRLRLQDAVTGTLLWEGEWPEMVSEWAPEWQAGFDAFSSVRWSSKGVWLSDGNGMSWVLDWRSLMVGEWWVVPISPGGLVGLTSEGNDSER